MHHVLPTSTDVVTGSPLTLRTADYYSSLGLLLADVSSYDFVIKFNLFSVTLNNINVPFSNK